MNNVLNEGKYNLLNFTLSTPTKPLDISPYVVMCDIYESILSPSIVAEIIVNDSTGIFSNIMLNEEELCISFTTNVDGPPIHYKLKIVEVNPVLRATNDKSVSFVLTCLNEEVIKSHTTIDVPLVRKKLECEKVVTTMMEKVLETEKDVYVEKTKGLHSFSFTDTPPMKAIDIARRVAISATHPGSAYVFFENAQGFHFKSLEKIVEDGLKRIGDKFFIHSALANADVAGSKWRNIIGYKLIQSGNHNVASLIGGYSTSSKRLNLIEGTLEYYEKKADEVEFVTLNPGSINASSERQQEKSKSRGGKSLGLYSSDEENNQLSEKMNFLPYYLSQFLSVIAHMTIYGDSTITVGDVLTCRIPEMNGLTTNEYVPDDIMTSGNYLICKVRHVLTFGDNPQYFQALEIIKDGIGGSMPNVNFHRNA